MERWRLWFRVTVTDPEGAEVGWDVGGEHRPDLRTLESMARLALLLRRDGASLRLSEVSPDMHDLLDLAGLTAELRSQPDG